MTLHFATELDWIAFFAMLRATTHFHRQIPRQIQIGTLHGPDCLFCNVKLLRATTVQISDGFLDKQRRLIWAESVHKTGLNIVWRDGDASAQSLIAKLQIWMQVQDNYKYVRLDWISYHIISYHISSLTYFETWHVQQHRIHGKLSLWKMYQQLQSVPIWHSLHIWQMHLCNQSISFTLKYKHSERKWHMHPCHLEMAENMNRFEASYTFTSHTCKYE